MSIQIQLRNFQGHKATNIELSDAINVLCGDTDAGKSSIIRALYWVCFNRPTGDGYIRKGADSMSVSINIYDAGGCVGTVTRGIDKKGNYYKLNGEESRAFRTDVPEPIKAFLNMAFQNFQLQHDNMFLVMDSPSARMKMLNSFLDFDKLVEVTGRAASNAYQSKQKLKFCTERVAEIE